MSEPATSPDPETEYLTAEQIASELGIHLVTVRRYFRENGLPGRKVGKSWRTTRAALNGWLTGAPVPAPVTGDTHLHLETHVSPTTQE